MNLIVVSLLRLRSRAAYLALSTCWDLMKKTMNANTFIQTTFRKTSPFRAP